MAVCAQPGLEALGRIGRKVIEEAPAALLRGRAAGGQSRSSAAMAEIAEDIRTEERVGPLELCDPMEICCRRQNSLRVIENRARGLGFECRLPSIELEHEVVIHIIPVQRRSI